MTAEGIGFEEVRLRELSDEETAASHAFSLVMEDEAKAARLLGSEPYMGKTAWQADLAAVGAYLSRG